MDYSKFRLRSFTRLKPYYSLHCGSNYELPIKYSSYKLSDLDVISYYYDICAIPWNRNPPKNTKCTILRIDSSNTPSGYARLEIDGNRRKDKPTYYCRPPMLGNVESGGPSIQHVKKCTDTFMERYKRGQVDVSIDIVFAIYCPYWPVEAEEWRKRKRFHGWPNEKLIARITRGGCHFVSKLRTWSSSDDTEWRFSFSKAELLLIHSWTPDQKFAYHIIRSIRRNISQSCGGNENKGLQTYYFKTLMLWACEEFPPEFWKEQNTNICVETVLHRFLRCLEEKFCPNYFIPDCNIMSHLQDEGSYEKELKMLRKIQADVNIDLTFKSTCELELLGSFELQCLEITQASFPNIEHLNGRFGEYLSECEWFLPGMKDLHAAVEANLRLMSLDNVTSRKESKDYVHCSEYFKLASIRYEDCESFKYSNPELSIFENLNVTCILLRRQTRNSIPIYRRCVGNAYERIFTESISSLLSCAASTYQTNLFFTALHSYKETLTECNRWIDAIDEAKLAIVDFDPNQFASYIPLLICNSLSQIYDEHLQVVLGFATLHRNISFSESSNSSTAHEVCLKLDAKEFLKYLYIQCERRLFAIRRRTVYFFPENLDYNQPCMSQLTGNVFFSTAILYAALRQSKAYTEPLSGKLIPRHYSHVP